ncbi:hypothetical protein SAMN05720766_12015 [Fibrobacter sp. UWH9]|uniref:hypothetical protein n=1 Tax=Fibrobacter sp. UWH9 TaxID=1896213 RepID=UPI0009129564|nr:hypothetical protein [Fibrobacter sp. UWH9]SHH70777.1 hypothetical protein SAMN05720766_12015 [Fibrobacter sp. UWH9]
MKTLSQLFTPPEGYVGQICVASALSADVRFLDSMLTEFTRMSNSKRRSCGNVSLLLMLDAKSARLDMDAASGFIQLQPNGRKRWDKIACMHAKVALMQFGKTNTVPSKSKTKDLIWRLVICTGNWTEASAIHQMEMAWATDYDCNVKSKDRKSLSDMVCIVDFLRKLQRNYAIDERIWAPAEILFKGIDASAAEVSSLPPSRVFTTFSDETMLESIAQRFRGIKPNYVIAGSGFFEQDDGKKGKPETIEKIEQKLKLTNVHKSDRHLVANQDTAGKVAVWSGNCLRDWNLHKPSDPIAQRTFMHAKYIYAGVKKRTTIGDGRLYLGSGNLSMTGLLGYACGKGKNIEAGVVITQSDFSGVKRTSQEALFKTLLCGSDEPSYEIKPVDENADGPDLEDNGACYKDPCPLLAFELILKEDRHVLRPVWLDDDPVKGLVLKRTGEELGKRDVATMSIPSGHDTVLWKGESYQIPVIVLDGMFTRLSAPTETELSLEELLSQLESSMNEKDSGDDDGDDEGPDEPDDPDGKGKNSGYANRLLEEKSYKYQSAMTLVETIAEYSQVRFEKYEDVIEEDVMDWISMIESKLRNLSKELIATWQSLEVDFISVLAKDNFAPPCKGKARTLWNNYIENWCRKWHLDKYEAL